MISTMPDWRTIRIGIAPLSCKGLRQGLNGSPTAPVERALLYRARSGSTGEPSAHDRRPMMMNHQPLIPDALKEIRG